MLTELLHPLPYLTADLPGIGGQIKQQPEDFVVEEIAAYEPCGEGDFLYLWIEKRDLGAEFFVRQVARRLGIDVGEVGMAGMKDRRAVARQWISVPKAAQAQLSHLDGDGIRLLDVRQHRNKLKPGHLRGNRFEIRIRAVEPHAAETLPRVISHLRRFGLPNFYGNQRFGKNGETLERGLDLLLGRSIGEGSRSRSRFLRKLALSAVQSALFNRYLGQRMADGLLNEVLLGDVMAKWPFGGIFTATDLDREQERFRNREIIHTGPIFGRKMFPPSHAAADYESRILEEAGISPSMFEGHGKLLQGTRRYNLIYLDDIEGRVDGGDVLLRFTLPTGSYATILLRELMKSTPPESEANIDLGFRP